MLLFAERVESFETAISYNNKNNTVKWKGTKK